MNIESKTRIDAVVTGAGSGLASAIARACARRGARVWMIDADAERLHRAVDEIVRAGGNVDFRVASVAEVAEAEDLVVDLRAKAPMVGGLVLSGPTSPGDLVLAHGLRPAMTYHGASVIVLAAGAAPPEADQCGLGPLMDALPDPSIGVNLAWCGSPLGGGEAGDPPDLRAAFDFLMQLRGDVRGYSFDLLHLAVELSTRGGPSVRSRLETVAERIERRATPD